MRKIIMAALVMTGLLVMMPESAYSQRSKNKKKSRVENVKNQFDGSYNYEVETVGVGTEGTKSLKVWAYGKNVDEAIALAKKCAVAACIYRGLPAAENVLATPALYPNPDPKWDDYFGEFFDDGGEYLNMSILRRMAFHRDRTVLSSRKAGTSAEFMFRSCLTVCVRTLRKKA